jgi:hypothetical protein
VKSITTKTKKDSNKCVCKVDFKLECLTCSAIQKGYLHDLHRDGRYNLPCQYQYIKIKDVVFKRDIGNIFDDRNSWDDGLPEGIPPFDPETEPDCRVCNVEYGQVHHIDCEMERCPSCRHQALSCDCDPREYFFELPTPKSINYKSLRKHIPK